MRNRLDLDEIQELGNIRDNATRKTILWALRILDSYRGPGGSGRYSTEEEAKEARKLYLKAYSVLHRRTAVGRASRREHDNRRKRGVDICAEALSFTTAMLKATSSECYYCHKPLAKAERVVDHYIPLCKGGEHKHWNMVVSCAGCNIAKSDMWPDDFEAGLRKW